MAGTNKLSDKKLKALLGSEREAPIMIADGEGLSVKVRSKVTLAGYFHTGWEEGVANSNV